MDQASAIRIIEQTHDRILIYQPPYGPFAIGFLAGGIVIAVAFYFLLRSLSVRPKFRFAGLVLALPFLFFGTKEALSKMFVEVSVPDQTLSVRRTGLFGSEVRTIPLHDVEGVVQLQARKTTAVGLRLRSGEMINLSGYTDQSGKNEMLSSLDLFLASARSRP